MATIGSLNIKVNKGAGRKNFVFDDIADGVHTVRIDHVYPWKEVTRDTKMWMRDDNNRLVKDDNGDRIDVAVPNLTWFSTDVVLTVVGGDYDGISTRYYLSTHPNFHGAKMQFLYRTGLIGELSDDDGNINLDDLWKHTGAEAKALVKHKVINIKDKDTGLMEEREIPYVSYFIDPNDVDNTDSGDNSIDGI